MEKKARLGRGLDALFGGEGNSAVATATPQVTIDAIDVNPNQPRKAFDKDEITSLCETIKATVSCNHWLCAGSVSASS